MLKTKVIHKAHNFQIILPNFTVIDALEVIYAYRICMEKIVHNVHHCPSLSTSVFNDDTWVA